MSAVAERQTFDPQVQRMEALRRANAVRTGIPKVREEIRSGVLSLEGALEDDRAQAMTAEALLMALPRVGASTAKRELGKHLIGTTRRVRDLTGRQKVLLIEFAERRNRRD